MCSRSVCALRSPMTALTLLAAAAAMTWPAQAWADRSTSLQGNRLIEDADDIYTYPHALGQYADRLTLDIAGPGQGNAAFLVDAGGWSWGVALHRGNLFDASSISRLNEQRAAQPLAYPSADDTGLAGFISGLGSPLTAADVLLGFGDLGVRVGLGSTLNTTTPPMGGESSAEATFATLALSYKLDAWDIALHSGFVSGELVAAGQTVESGSIFQVAAVTRGYIPMSEQWRLGVLGRVGFATQSVELPQGMAFERSASRFEAQGGAGPSITLTERAKVAAYATLGLSSGSGDPNSTVNNDNGSRTLLLLPGANLAMEVKLTRWLYVRAGAEYNHAVLMGGQLAMDGETTTTANAAGFDWRAGVGLAYEGFTLDGTLSSGYLNQGPDFIGGDAPLFALVSLGYDFGQAATLPTAPASSPSSSSGSSAQESIQARPPAPTQPAATPSGEDMD